MKKVYHEDDYVIDRGEVIKDTYTPEDITMFLYKDALKLSKVTIGNYLGSQ